MLTITEIIAALQEYRENGGDQPVKFSIESVLDDNPEVLLQSGTLFTISGISCSEDGVFVIVEQVLRPSS